METIPTALICALAVSSVSLIGAATFSFSGDSLEKITNYLLSLAAGAMLGNAMLHMLPHALENTNRASASQIVTAAHHIAPSSTTTRETQPIAIEETPDYSQLNVFGILLLGFFAIFALDLALLARGNSQNNKVKPLGYLILFSDGLENFMDGLVIGTAFLINIPTGIATTIAIFIHEIPMELGDFAILTHSGFSRKKALLLNFASAIVNVIGVISALILNNTLSNFTAFATPFAAGTLIYMATTGLLPQVREHNSVKQKFLSFCMTILGVVFMALLLLLE